jgi:hypothetical protein
MPWHMYPDGTAQWWTPEQHRQNVIVLRAARTHFRLMHEHGPLCRCQECERASKRLWRLTMEWHRRWTP